MLVILLVGECFADLKYTRSNKWGYLIMNCRKGDAVTARRRIDGMNVPVVPAGSHGVVVATTLLGRPKRVEFIVDDGWGTKQFQFDVAPDDITPAAGDELAPQQSR